MDNLIDQIISELESLADPKRAEGEKHFFKESINNLGVSSPKVDKVEKKLYSGTVKKWSMEQTVDFVEMLLERRIFEVSQLGLSLLQRFADKMGENELVRFEKWLNADLCDNWAATDTLCPHTVGTILDNGPHLTKRVRLWADSKNRWVKRGSAVSYIILARRGKFLDEAYENAAVLIDDKKDDLIQKANGWMLREAGKTDPDRLEVFLLKNGSNIPRTTLRYAIEKYSKEKRRELLLATK